jgi:micrococcal nuclease
MRRDAGRRIGAAGTVLFFLAVAAVVLLRPDDDASVGAEAARRATRPSESARDTFAVVKVVDGDTVRVQRGKRTATVRLIGVDTPETMHPNKPVERYGKEASAFTRRLLLGERVRLEYDQQRRDRYGRTLAYVYRERDGLFVNAEIIRRGYGHADTRFPFRHLDEFRRLEREARQKRRGLWGP